MIWIALAAVVAALLVLLLARAAAFRPKQVQKSTPYEVEVDDKKIIGDMCELIRCKTVSYRDKSLIDEAEFDRLRALLPKLYPAVYNTCEMKRVGDTGLLFKWKGEAEAEPTVLMAHYDVVPVNEDQWEKPAFEAIIDENDVLWGRGTLDTKGTFCGVLESCEQLIKSGFVPKNDIYLSFSGDEEVAGSSAPAIVAELERLGVKPQLVVDEGGAVVDGVFPGVTQPCALVGIGEKGMLDVEFSVKSSGGHASAPPPHTPVGILSAAAVAVENHPFKCRITPPAAEMFDTLGRHSTFVFRLIFANLWLFKPILDAMTKKSGGELNALMRTSVAFTQMQGSKASNVIPPEAKMVANLRLAGGDTVESAVEGLKNKVGDSRVSVTALHGMNPSIYSDTTSKGWLDTKAAIEETWPEAIVSPYLMIACSDSRHFCRISDKVMRFSAMPLSKEERGLIHGNNERIPTAKLVDTVKFYIRLIQKR